MGELADDVRSLASPGNSEWLRAARIAERVDELEAERDRLLDVFHACDDVPMHRHPRLDAAISAYGQASDTGAHDYRELDIRTRLAAAEKRAEQAERQAAIAMDAQAHALKLMHLGSFVVAPGSIAEMTSTPGSAIEFRFGASCSYSTEPQRLVLAIYTAAPDATPDLLERRGMELIEAGERLLVEYKQQQETARKQQEASNG